MVDEVYALDKEYILVDMQKKAMLPFILKGGKYSDSSHKLQSMSQLKSCAFINKTENLQEHISYKNQIEGCIVVPSHLVADIIT
jgi:hypothetical protein